jgi:hypothetical protein
MLPKKITLKHMNKITAAITAIGSYVPEYVLSNQVLETLVDTNDEWITSRTGIKERRLLKEEGKGTSFLAIKAAQNLLEKAKLDPKEIDLVIMATATPDMPVASTGVYVATQIGATNAFAFDLQAACSSFLFGMSTASAFIQSGKYKKMESYVKGWIPERIKDMYLKETNQTYSSIISKVYTEPLANRYLATVSKFVGEHIDEEPLRKLVKDNFSDFMKYNILPYNEVRKIGFIGSVADVFSDILKEVCEEYGFEVSSLKFRPILPCLM